MVHSDGGGWGGSHRKCKQPVILVLYHLEGRVDELNDICELGKIKMHVPDYPTLEVLP